MVREQPARPDELGILAELNFHFFLKLRYDAGVEDDGDEIKRLIIKAGQATEFEWAVKELVTKNGMSPHEAEAAVIDSFRPQIKKQFGTPRKKKTAPAPKAPIVLPEQRTEVRERPKSANVLDDIKWAYEHYALPKAELAKAMRTAPGGALSILAQLQDPENDTFKRTFWTGMVPKLVAHQKAVEDESKRGMRSAAILDMIDRILTEAEHAARPSPPNASGESPVPSLPDPPG